MKKNVLLGVKPIGLFIVAKWGVIRGYKGIIFFILFFFSSLRYLFRSEFT